MNSQDGDVPLLAQTVAGNSSDKKLFRENLQALKKEIEQGEEGYFIADSALYTKETIGEISSHLKWITLVPETNREAKALLNSSLEMVPLEEGYSGIEITSQYGETPQRWLVVDSAKAKEKKEKTLRNQINKEYVTQSKEGKKFQRQQFSCEEDAKRVLQEWSKKLRYHRLIDTGILIKKSKKGRGRPSPEDTVEVNYHLQARIVEDKGKIEEKSAFLGRFIIATNELNAEKLSSQEMLANYKEQQCVERGFRFLKDSSFMTLSVFLKKQERIIALGMVMCLCLLVYTIAQRQIRRLKETGKTVPSQIGKPTQKPSLKWIFHIFEGVHVLLKKTNVQRIEIVLNLKPVHLYILAILGSSFEKIYAST